ncbi:MAG: YbaK/EbsC family protein [Gammaproteobacteria bacterium]|jgi:Ala-tRNA(Pro) deacylase
MLKTLCDFLDGHNIRYLSMRHSLAYTAQEIAASAHVHGQEFAKTVIVNIDGELAMAVLPAPEKLDPDLLAAAAGAKEVALADENEFQGRFPKCEPGAMPPFGNLFDMKVYVEEKLAANDKITFNAGTHTELIQMSFRDYRDLVQPEIVRLCRSYADVG